MKKNSKSQGVFSGKACPTAGRKPGQWCKGSLQLFLGSLSWPTSCILFASLVLIAIVFIICSNTGRLNALRGLFYFTKQSHMNHLLLFCFCFCLKKEKKACHWVRCAGIQCLVGQQVLILAPPFWMCLLQG